jgi:tRNA-specific adenosine deaminase 3
MSGAGGAEAPAAAAGAPLRPRLVRAPPPGLRLAAAWAAAVEPRRCGALLKELGDAAPVAAHLKRVRREAAAAGGDATIRVLLCVADEAQNDTDAEPPLPPAVADAVERYGLQPQRVHVPARPPPDRAAAAEWGVHWPISVTSCPPRADADADAVSEAEAAAMRAGIAAAEQHAAAAAAAGGRCNGAVIVDPATGAVVAAGRDASLPRPGGGFAGWRQGGGGSHPLRHAVIAALDEAARRDLATYHAPTTAQAAAELQGLDAAGVKRKHEASVAAAAPRPYLCTGWDCYVVHEPCLMCAMALVHSRVRRVVYARPDAAAGALESAARLHDVRSLNHRYDVYCMDAA